MLRLTTFCLLLFASFHLCKAQQPLPADLRLPNIGKWLEKSDGEPADWLGQKVQNKELIEPINVVIIDSFATSPQEAIHKLLSECRKDGYKDKKGHSWGYLATVDSIRVSQLPDERKKALSNRNFLFTNNHGRIMGPQYYDGKYIFVGAFSREAFRLFNKAHHIYRSFLAARNDFSERLDHGHTYKIIGEYNLENSLDDDYLTTGDHDGYAILLYAEK